MSIIYKEEPKFSLSKTPKGQVFNKMQRHVYTKVDLDIFFIKNDIGPFSTKKWHRHL